MSENNNNQNGWAKWSRYVLSELERQDKCINKIFEDLNKIRVQQAVLQVKSGIWGVIGASIPLLLGFILWLLRNHLR